MWGGGSPVVATPGPRPWHEVRGWHEHCGIPRRERHRPGGAHTQGQPHGDKESKGGGKGKARETLVVCEREREKERDWEDLHHPLFWGRSIMESRILVNKNREDISPTIKNPCLVPK